MSRSILITFLIVFLAMANVDQTHGLAGIVNRVRNNSIWGKSRTINNSRQQNSLLPVQVTMSKQESADESSSSLPNLTTPPVAFDADSYRQEMTDLVYKRNMQRTFKRLEHKNE